MSSYDQSKPFAEQFFVNHDGTFESVVNSLITILSDTEATPDQKKQVLKDNIQTVVLMSATFDAEASVFSANKE